MMEKVKRYYSEALAASKHFNGTVVGIHYMEESDNKNDGLRYLLEMDVQLDYPRNELVHTSEYTDLKKEPSMLCHTSNFQWVRDTYIYFVVSGEYIYGERHSMHASKTALPQCQYSH